MRHIYLGSQKYEDALELQRELVALVADREIQEHVLYLEHPPTLTLGRGTDMSNILVSDQFLADRGATIHLIDRGGDVTYHGPGQLVGYPIINIANYQKDLHWYLRKIEEVLIVALARFGVEARRFPPHTGVWVGDKKIAAIGIKVSRWVTSHGFALNINPNMDHFKWIVPCGIRDYGVTSISELIPTIPSLLEVSQVTAKAWTEVLGDLNADSPNWDASLLSDNSQRILASGIDLYGGE